ncbi:hypothetical protein JOF53_000836 [Crossiella equi]|uniref:ATP synthase F0 subunit 8 n=1 Tax=Crossiella equi TaxID=130796 RepID=A0ABS5A5T4_9PSEU|nr:hypothetical protein [Crossiella equi]
MSGFELIAFVVGWALSIVAMIVFAFWCVRIADRTPPLD